MGALLNKNGRLLFASVATLCGVAIALSLTRTVYIYGISVVLFSAMLVFTKRAGDVMKGLVPVALLVSLVMIGVSMTGDEGIGSAVGSRFSSIASAFLDEKVHTTLDDRRMQFEAISEYVRSTNIPPIFGVGVTDLSVMFVTSDLGYINIILNMGLLGLTIIIWWVIYLLRMSLRLWKASSSISHRVLSGSILASMPGILITGINFDYFTGRYFFWLLTATVVLEVLRRQISQAGQFKDTTQGARGSMHARGIISGSRRRA
jgi:hypothetical protein